jgi:hypothetical protein
MIVSMRTRAAKCRVSVEIARQHFLMVKDAGAGVQPAAPAAIVVVLNWFEELRAKVATGR